MIGRPAPTEAAVTLTLSCWPLGLPMASLFALGVPRIFSTRMSPSQAQKESIADPLRPELSTDFDFSFFGFATGF
ncbi:MAG: hypothetical protein ACR65R_12115 [Methylomicrobium sp.]